MIPLVGYPERIIPGFYRILYSGFNPRSLFRNGEQGVIYDPNDLTTLFQDSAGTTPVTAAGQPVGLMLDKSGRGNHAFQTNAASRPMLRQNAVTGAYYLETDGSDDWMSTSAIDFTGTNSITVLAGLTKLSDALGKQFIEMSSAIDSNTGAIDVRIPAASSAPNYLLRSKGTLMSSATTPSNYPAPHTAVLTHLASIGTDTNKVRINGVQVADVTTDQGIGNYGNHILYLFRRNGTLIPINCHFYGLVIVGRLTTVAETRNVERLYANKTGVTLA